MIQTQFQTKIHVLRINNGKEYFSSILRTYLKKNEIIHQSSYVNTARKTGLLHSLVLHHIRYLLSTLDLFKFITVKYMVSKTIK